MKKYKNLIIGIAALAAIGGVGAGCYYYGSMSTSQAIEAAAQEKASVKKDLETYMSKEHSKAEIKEKLLAELPKLEVQDRTILVDSYIYGSHSVAQNTVISDKESEIINKAINEKGELDLGKIEDEDLKKEIEAMSENCVVLKCLNGQIFWDVDWNYFIDTFGDLVRSDYRGMLEFYGLEKERSYYDTETASLKTDIVTDLLDKAYDLYSKYSDSDMSAAMKDNYNFYKCVYFGAYYQDYIWTDKATIKTELVESYKEYAEKTKDPELKVFIENLVQQYSNADNARTVPIMEMIKEFCGISETAQTTDVSNVTVTEYEESSADNETTATNETGNDENETVAETVTAIETPETTETATMPETTESSETVAVETK